MDNQLHAVKIEINGQTLTGLTDKSPAELQVYEFLLKTAREYEEQVGFLRPHMRTLQKQLQDAQCRNAEISQEMQDLSTDRDRLAQFRRVICKALRRHLSTNDKMKYIRSLVRSG